MLREYASLKIPAGQAVPIGLYGDYIRLDQAAVRIQFQTEKSVFTLAAGGDVELERFSEVLISHKSGSEQTISIYIGDGDKVGSANISGAVTLSGQNGAYTQGRTSVSNTAVTLFAANASRRAFEVQNNSLTAVMRLTVNTTAPSATAGFRVQPGETYTSPDICPTGDVRAIMETADATANNVEWNWV